MGVPLSVRRAPVESLCFLWNATEVLFDELHAAAKADAEAINLDEMELGDEELEAGRR